MDISVYISELLYEHDCIIIPGFGGLVCNYKPAEIHPVLNTLSPPCKAITFNRSLQNNDGLLVNHIAQRRYLSFEIANALVTGWVAASHSLLQHHERVTLPKIGVLYTDVEQHLQFEQDPTCNYLKTAYGLRTFEAPPVIHPKVISLTDTTHEPDTTVPLPNRNLRKIAALVVLLLAIAGLAQLMWLGIEIKPLKADEAGMSSFITSLFTLHDPALSPVTIELPVPDNTAAITSVVEPESNLNNDHPATVTSTSPAYEAAAPATAPQGYYIIVGAFKHQDNIQSLRNTLLQQHEHVLTDPQNGLTRVGYFADTDLQKAKEQLHAARQSGVSCWLLKK